MERRIHEVLDGERSPGELTPGEGARLRRYREAIDQELGAIAREPVPDLVPAVMERVAARGRASVEGSSTDRDGLREGARAAVAWLWRPRSVQLEVRPVWASAALAALILALAPGARAPAGAPEIARGTAEPRVMVQFRLDAPDATAVRLAGDFSEWEPAYEMRQQAPGVWSVVVPLEPGVHDYGFVVDGGEWRTDPLAPRVADGFGGSNSRLALLVPDAEERS